MLLAFIGCQSLNNGTPIYTELKGGTNAFAGMLILEFSAAAAITRIAIGRVIDKRSRRRFIVMGGVLMLIGTAGAIVVPVLESQVVFRAIQGAGFGAITTAASTATADVAPASRLGEALGYNGLGQSLGFAIGPTLAIVLLSFTWHEALFAGVAVISICLIVLGLLFSYEKHPERLDPTSAYAVALRSNNGDSGAPSSSSGDEVQENIADRKALSDNGGKEGSGVPLVWRLFEKGALPGAIPMFVSCLGYAIIVSFVSKYGVNRGLVAPGTFFICAAVTMTLIRVFGGQLIDRLKPLPLLAAPLLCGVACFAILATNPSEPLFYTAGGFFGLSMGLAFPLFNTMCVRCAPTERRGAASALYGLSNDMGIGIGSVAWGAVIDATGYGVVFWGGMAIMVVTFVFAALVFPRN